MRICLIIFRFNIKQQCCIVNRFNRIILLDAECFLSFTKQMLGYLIKIIKYVYILVCGNA